MKKKEGNTSIKIFSIIISKYFFLFIKKNKTFNMIYNLLYLLYNLFRIKSNWDYFDLIIHISYINFNLTFTSPMLEPNYINEIDVKKI